jgi:Holliday junction DNA helicase RuvA
MICRISGILEAIAGGSAIVDAGGGLCYEVLVPACDWERLTRRVGQEVVLHTIHYIEGDPSHGGQTPRLIGFQSAVDRDFFRVFTTVKGIGNKRALRALARPIAEVAAAIQAKDARYLVELPEIGKRTAEQIIAEIHGKVDAFAGAAAGIASVGAEAGLSQAASEAVAVFVQLGERRPDAVALVERVLAGNPGLDSPEAIIQQAYRVKAGAK